MSLLIGSKHCGGTLRIKEFLTRNGHPFRYRRSRPGCRRPGAARPLSCRRSRRPGADLPRRRRCCEDPSQPGDRRLPGFQRAHRSHPGARRRHRRRGSGRTRGGGVRRVRGARRAGARVELARRSGGLELEDRELPGFSDGHLGPGAGRPGLRAGAEVRRRSSDRAKRRRRSPASESRIGIDDRRRRCACRRAR